MLATFLFTFLVSHPEVSKNKEWEIGEEREIVTGRYARYINEENGWRYWRFETIDGTTCHAVKPVEGGGPLTPNGRGEAMQGAYPYIDIGAFKKYINTDFKGSGDGSVAKYRKPNARFWVDYTPALIWDFTILDGRKIEVSVVSWEYPNLKINGFHQQGMIDLTGHNAARQWVKECAKKK